MRRFWTKVRWLILLVGLVALSCLVISTALVDKALYAGVIHGGTIIGLESQRKQQKRSIDLESTLKSNIKADEDFSKQIIDIAKAIYKAKKHVRGSKTSDYLKEALSSMDTLLKNVGIDRASVYSRNTHAPKSVCPEVYRGSTFGYPFFYKGFEISNCTHGVPIWKLVTIVRRFNENQTLSQIERFISSVYKTNSNLSINIAVNSAMKANVLKETFPNLTVETYASSDSDGTSWNSLVQHAKTPYVLIARNVEFLTNDSRLERLVREYESLDVAAVGGASRDSLGHWKKGCFQSVYRNFSFRYLEGYDESLHECIFCDYMEGPFLVSKEYFNKNKFRDLSENGGLFHDWFLNVAKEKGETVACPDSMFHVGARSETKPNSDKWHPMMTHWDLYMIRTPNGETITRPCPKSRTMHDSACDVQSNAHAVKTIMSLCEDNDIYCELQEGTALGAVKLEKTLPWERDADITFLTANFTAFDKLHSVLGRNGIVGNANGAVWCCVDGRKAGGKFMLHYQGWNIEMYGQHIMDSEQMVLDGMKPTKVLLDGQWVNVPRNPGLFVRNRYGKEMYQHALHWMTLGHKSGWDKYETNTFQPCKQPGEHYCLDRCNADGNLPFEEMLP